MSVFPDDQGVRPVQEMLNHFVVEQIRSLLEGGDPQTYGPRDGKKSEKL